MPDLRRKPNILIPATVATARFFPSDDISTDVTDSSPCFVFQYSHEKDLKQKTDLKSNNDSKFSSLWPVDVYRWILVHVPIRTFRNRPDANLSIPPAYQETVVGSAADMGFLWETSQSAMVLPPELLDWYYDGRCVESCDTVSLENASERRNVAIPPVTNMLKPFVSNVAMALTSF